MFTIESFLALFDSYVKNVWNRQICVKIPKKSFSAGLELWLTDFFYRDKHRLVSLWKLSREEYTLTNIMSKQSYSVFKK